MNDCEFRIVMVDDSGFHQHAEVLQLLRESFAFMEGRIDPPSSLHRIDLPALKKKVRDELLFIALAKNRIIGCVFASEQTDCLYLGKLAVDVNYRGLGVARQLIANAEAYARGQEIRNVDVETRVELIDNQQLFERLGYRKYSESAHKGYARTTSFRYRKVLDLE